ncbi:hypothetical protein ACIRBX_07355 [Kitasatospora sp. NPDC096147]|uniref:hypothetical protein n=1 Tax=Kitasatospora sp. NPDC096147 TaxID=3364093 RepID=UPI00382DDDC6
MPARPEHGGGPGPAATELHHDLARVPDLDRVGEAGVQDVHAPAATGRSAVCPDAVPLR